MMETVLFAPALAIIAPAPADQLLNFYQQAEAATGVGRNYLAAINLVETTFGRIAGASSADARGPMQFLPSTFAQYGAGGDIMSPHDAIMAAGAKDVVIAATHPILSGPAAERLNAAPFEEVIVTNTLPIPEGVNIPKLTTLSVAPLIAEAIRQIFTDGSVTSLFDGASL